ncbi:MAG: hypothetical protein HY540_05325 [Deltaproteobacteria bacterium]|nr:hypothetical protein [Deltaproteobacteria bacterium]
MAIMTLGQQMNTALSFLTGSPAVVCKAFQTLPTVLRVNEGNPGILTAVQHPDPADANGNWIAFRDQVAPLVRKELQKPFGSGLYYEQFQSASFPPEELHLVSIADLYAAGLIAQSIANGHVDFFLRKVGAVVDKRNREFGLSYGRDHWRLLPLIGIAVGLGTAFGLDALLEHGSFFANLPEATSLRLQGGIAVAGGAVGGISFDRLSRRQLNRIQARDERYPDSETLIQWRRKLERDKRLLS